MLCQWLYFTVVKCRVLSFVEEEEPGMWVMGYYVLSVVDLWIAVESVIDGVVLFMCGFFSRSGQLIEISRWVICKVTYETIVRFAIMCMCHSNDMFVFSARRKERKFRWKLDGRNSGRWQENLLVVGSGDSELKLCIGFQVLLTEYGCNEIILVAISCLAAITIGGITTYSTIYQLVPALTWGIIHMGQKTWGPCPIKVSHGSRCKVVLRRWWLYS